MKKLLLLIVFGVVSIVFINGQNVFFDGFETGNTHGSAVVGWTQAPTSIWTANNTNTTYNRTPRTGSWNAILIYGSTNWMFKQVSLIGGVNYTLSFYARQDATSEANIRASYGTTNTEAGMTNSIIASTALTSGGYQYFSGSFTPATSGTYYIGIRGDLTFTPWYISIDDISLDYIGTPCSGTPAPGITLASSNPVCSGAAFTLSMSTPPATSGITYQWQTSPTGGNPWTNIAGATSSTYSATQTVGTYYRCRVTCANGGGTANSSSLQVTMAAPSSCYCTPSGSSASYYINNFSTTGGSTNITNNGSGYSAGGYGVFTGQVVTQVQNSSVNFSADFLGGTHGCAIWVDWNQDGTFAAGERMFVTSAYATTAAGSFTVPMTALPGNTRMRVKAAYSNSAPSDPCRTAFSGEMEDYTFNVVATTPCSGTPAPGNTLSTSNPVCSGVGFTLSLSNSLLLSGITYQWQSSPNGTAWTNIPGATSSTYAATQTVGTYYRCVVTCANGGGIGYSTSLQVTMAAPSSCYCIPSGSSASYFIDDFSTTGGSTNITNNNTGYSAGGYGVFTGQVVTQVQNSSVNFSISNDGGAYTYGFAIWVDWNQNGTFEAGERMFVTSAYATTAAGSFTVPMTALPGNTRMRVKAAYSNLAPSDPCRTAFSGEMEDYTFNVVQLVPCSGTPVGGTANATATSGCSGYTSVLSVTGATLASGLTYQWYSSPTGGAPWTAIPGATGETYTATVTTPLYYRRITSCTASGGTGTSTSVQTVVNSFLYCYCTSTATSTVDMDITKVTFGTINNTTANISLTGTQGTATGTAGMYSDWRSSAVPVPSFMQGSTNVFSVSIGGTAYGHQVVVYIDFNQNGSFADAGESFMVFAYANPTLPNTTSYNITIPLSAATGNTGMRIVCVESSSSVSSCGTYTWGETEDYIINITLAPPCSGTPTGGTAAASSSSCGHVGGIYVTGSTVASGLTYQWYSAPAAAGPWTLIAGATGDTYMPSVSGLYYRREIRCTASGLTANSSSLQYTTTAPANDECINATPLTVNANVVCSSVKAGTVLCASASAQANPCSGYADDDVWYSFVATSTSHTISLLNIAGSTTDMYHAVYSGTCGSLTNIKCSDADASTVAGLTIGDTYYVRVYTYTSTSGQTTTFNICVGTPSTSTIVGSDNCVDAQAVCADAGGVGINFGAENNSPFIASPVGQCTYLRNPSWWYFQIESLGPIVMGIASCGDVDFACYGPFNNFACVPADLVGSGSYTYYTSGNSGGTYVETDACEVANLAIPSGNLVDAAYSVSATEILNINPVAVGDYYILIIGNYNNCTGVISLNQTNFGAPGAGSIDCDIVTQCNITSITANTTFNGATYTVYGNINFTDPPNNGNLKICEGVICQTFYPPFTSPTAYSLSGLASDGMQHTLVATFSSTTSNCSKLAIHTAPLPVELVAFDANCLETSADIYWQTASELNNNYFILEKRKAENGFYEIARLQGAGNSNTLVDYHFVDKKMLPGDNYYRLLQVDYDGTVTTYKAIALNCDKNIKGEPIMQAYPNPFKDEINVVIKNIDEGDFTLEIINELGKVVYHEKFTANSSEYQTMLTLNNLQSAVYNLRLNSKKNVVNIRVVKQ